MWTENPRIKKKAKHLNRKEQKHPTHKISYNVLDSNFSQWLLNNFQFPILPETCLDPHWRCCCCHWLLSWHEHHGMRFSLVPSMILCQLLCHLFRCSYTIIQDWDCSREICAQNQNDELNPPGPPHPCDYSSAQCVPHLFCQNTVTYSCFDFIFYIVFVHSCFAEKD